MNTGDTTASINQLSGGEYSCLVSDANNCHTELINVELSEPAMPLMLDSATVIDNFICNDSSGSVTLFVSGGTPGYQFLWNTGDNSEIIEIWLKANMSVLLLMKMDVFKYRKLYHK